MANMADMPDMPDMPDMDDTGHGFEDELPEAYEGFGDGSGGDDLEDGDDEDRRMHEKIYEKNIEEYTRMEYQYRICRDRVAFFLEEIRRIIPENETEWEAWGYRVPKPGAAPEASPAGEGGNLPRRELRPQFYPPRMWQGQTTQKTMLPDPFGIQAGEEGAEDWTASEAPGAKDAEDSAKKAGGKPDGAEKRFCYQKIGPDIDPSAGPPMEQWWHWALNVVVDEIPWVESRPAIQEMWKLRWAEHYPETYNIVAKYAGWETGRGDS